MSKIQILKAIHNKRGLVVCCFPVVSDVKDTNFESYSQQLPVPDKTLLCCFRCQRYKFWKLFTTAWFYSLHTSLVVSDVKDTNFESYSQRWRSHHCGSEVVSDVKDTNFESYSQHGIPLPFPSFSCFRCQRYKFWKLFTTNHYRLLSHWGCFRCQRYKFWKLFTTTSGKFFPVQGCFRCQRYKFWKLFTTKPRRIRFCKRLFQMSKIQILKAIHNKGLKL